jgi:uncharacterized protein YjbI with pentapeptide repeats
MTEARCVETDCRGVAVSQGRCVGHVDEDVLASYVADLLPHGMWDARGATIDETRCLQLVELLASAEFTGDTNFSGAQFIGEANFSGAQFTGGAVNFTEAQFTGGNASFGSAQFTGGDVNFRDAQFGGDAKFAGAQFSRTCSSAHFVAPLWTCGARFSRASSRYTPPVRQSQLATCVREKASLWPGVGAKSR